MFSPKQILLALEHKLEVADFIILIYVVAFVRQYSWFISSNTLAWTITISCAFLLWIVHFKTKPEKMSPPASFWLIVGVPIVFFYTIRFALPDMSWDVLDYRLINGELGLRGWPIRPGDFFPVRFPFNPAPDMVMSIGRHVLGYRFGTIINLAVLLWIGLVLNRLIQPWLNSPWLRSFAILLLLLTEHLLFEVSNYMVDLLALPLLLEASRLVLELPADARRRRSILVRVGFYLGAAVAFKLTNVAFVIPIVTVLGYQLWRRSHRDAAEVLYCVAALILPLVPYSLFMYSQTGNPFFPLFNGVFRSIYWPEHDLHPERWGPIVDDASFNTLTLWERLIWPVLLPFRIAHTAGDLGPHLGRVTIGFLSSIIGVCWRGAHKSIRKFAFITLVGSMIWSIGSGMLRYAGFVEVAGGVVAVYLIVRFFRALSERPQTQLRLSRAAGFLLAGLLIIQSAAACVYAFDFEWGGRLNIFRQPREHLSEAQYLLRDRDPRVFISQADRELFHGVDVWLEAAPMTAGLQNLLRPDTPLWCVYMDEFFQTEAAKQRFADLRTQSGTPRMFTLSLNDWLPFTKDKLSGAGFEIIAVKALSLPYYSDRFKFHTLLLVEVKPAGEAAPMAFEVTAAEGPQAQDAFNATLVMGSSPVTNLRVGERRTIYVSVINSGKSTWPARGNKSGNYRLTLGNHWLDNQGNVFINDDGRMTLPFDIPPGGKVDLPLTVTAPLQGGSYLLELDMLQEGVTWFSLKGSKALRVPIVVND